MKDRPGISKAEMDVLRSLWTHGAGNVRDVGSWLRNRRRTWAYTTVQTLLARLESKGYVSCDRTNVPHVFAAAVTKEGLVRQRLRDLADELCGGAATPLVMALVKGGRFSPEEIAQFRKLIKEMAPGQEKEEQE